LSCGEDVSAMVELVVGGIARDWQLDVLRNVAEIDTVSPFRAEGPNLLIPLEAFLHYGLRSTTGRLRY